MDVPNIKVERSNANGFELWKLKMMRTSDEILAKPEAKPSKPSNQLKELINPVIHIIVTMKLKTTKKLSLPGINSKKLMFLVSISNPERHAMNEIRSWKTSLLKGESL